MSPGPSADPQRWRTVTTLGAAQTLAWASSYYLPAILAAPMARELGLSMPTVFAAFSVALVISALVGPVSGRAIDRHGGRPVLMGTNLIFAAGLVSLGLAQGPVSLFAAWALIGLAMGSGLYEAAFAALVRLYGAQARNPITGITLMAGFASTVGWPLSTLLALEFGWRGACFTWAALHLLLGLPLNAMLPRVLPAHPLETGPSHSATAPATPPPPSGPRRTTAVLAYVFAATWFVSTSMATHLPQLLQAAGATLAVAVGAGALIGPAQVAGRLAEFGLLRRVHPLASARLAALAQPLGSALLLGIGAPAALAFVLLHGVGNGILTIAKGTLPLALFGHQGYGARQGWLTLPARFAQAAAPFLFGLALQRWGAGALWLSGALGLSAVAALLLLPRQPPAATAGSA